MRGVLVHSTVLCVCVCVCRTLIHSIQSLENDAAVAVKAVSDDTRVSVGRPLQLGVLQDLPSVLGGGQQGVEVLLVGYDRFPPLQVGVPTFSVDAQAIVQQGAGKGGGGSHVRYRVQCRIGALGGTGVHVSRRLGDDVAVRLHSLGFRLQPLDFTGDGVVDGRIIGNGGGCLGFGLGFGTLVGVPRLPGEA